MFHTIPAESPSVMTALFSFPGNLCVCSLVICWSDSLSQGAVAFVVFLQMYLFLSRTDPEPQEENRQHCNLYTLTTSLVFPSSFLCLVTLVFIELTLGATRDV